MSKINYLRFGILTVAVILLAAFLAAPVSADTSKPDGYTVTAVETWDLAGSPYIVGNLTIASGGVLNLAPGVELHVRSGKTITVNSGGVLNAAGIEGQGIAITTSGTDTFKYIEFKNGSTVNLAYCDISRGGNGSVEGIIVRSSGVTFDHCAIHDFVSPNHVLYLDGVGPVPTIQNTEIHHNTGAALYQNTINMNPVYTNLNIHDNTYNWLEIVGGSLTSDLTFDGSPSGLNAPVYINNTLTVKNGYSLTLGPGTTFRFKDNTSMAVEGGATFVAQGNLAQPITITSTGSEAYFSSINFMANSTVTLDFCDISHGGRNTLSDIQVRSSGVSFNHCFLHDFLNPNEIIWIDGAGNTPSFRNTTFQGDALRPIFQNSINILPIYENLTFTTAGAYPGVVIANSDLTRSLTLDQADVNGAPFFFDGLDIMSGGTLTLTPGTELRFFDNRGLTVQSGGVLSAVGSETWPVTFTSSGEEANFSVFNFQAGSTVDLNYCDISHGGKNYSQPIQVRASAVSINHCNLHDFVSPNEVIWLDGAGNAPSIRNTTITSTALRPIFQNNIDMQVTYENVTMTAAGSDSLYINGGSLNRNVMLDGQTGFHGNAIVFSNHPTVNAGYTLTIAPGTVIKLPHNITIHVRGSLVAVGTAAQPVVFTSIKDDAFGGDTNKDGIVSTPAPGDWNNINGSGGGSVTLNHALVRYGGKYDNTTGPIIHAHTPGFMLIENSTISDGYGCGVQTWFGAPLIQNSLIIRNDRGVCLQQATNMTVLNSVVDHNRIGITQQESGTLNLTNSLVTNNSDAGLLDNLVGGVWNIHYSDIWNPVDFADFPSQVGSNGNISADPKYKNALFGNYRLGYRSPAIDAADGTAAPEFDIMGEARYDDPRTPNTGIVTTGGAYADMGAYEFVESAPSNIDLVVGDIEGPAVVIAGETATLNWVVTNQGSEEAVGPWHDVIALYQGPDDSPTLLFAAEVQVGSGVTLGAGQSLPTSADVRIPGGTLGEYYWQVETNARGEVYEGANWVNNTGLSLAAVTLDLPELVIDGPALNRAFTSPRQEHWFKFNPVADQVTVVTLDSLANSGINELYLAEGYMPTRQQFDVRFGERLKADISAVITPSLGQTCYVLVYSNSLPAAPQNFTIQANAPGFELTSVSPGIVGNAGQVTLEFKGVYLSGEYEYHLIAQDATEYAASEVYEVDHTQVLATFAMPDIPVGVYDARVRNGATEGLLEDSVTVEDGGGPKVWADLAGLSTVRVNSTYHYTINFGNSGSTDAVSDVIYIHGIPTNADFTPGPEFAATPQPVGLENVDLPSCVDTSDEGKICGPLVMPVIPPGVTAQGTFTVSFPDVGDYEVTLSTLHVEAASGSTCTSCDSTWLEKITSANQFLPTALRKGSFPSLLCQVAVQDALAAAAAMEVAYGHWGHDNVFSRMLNSACDGAQFDLMNALDEKANLPGSNLEGYQFERVYKGVEAGKAGAGHYTTIMSKDGRYYAVDNYVTPTVVPMVKSGDGYIVDPSCNVSPFHLGHAFIALDKIISVLSLHPSFKSRQGEVNYSCARPRQQQKRTISVRQSLDPNDKEGPTGVGSARYLNGGELFTYTVKFENLEAAYFPAQQVLVTDVLDDNLDLSTLELASIRFNGVDLAVPGGLDHYDGMASVASDPNPVKVHAELDASTRTLTWLMQSIDPITGLLVEDPLAGFLPPNDATQRGEGSVTYTVRALPGLTTGTEIRNKAEIIFDVNPAIETPEWINTIDVTPPASQVEPLPAKNKKDFTVRWDGSDFNAGILLYDIYVSDDGGDYVLWQVGVTLTEAVFHGESGHTYRFYSLATDGVGNREETPLVPDAQTEVQVYTYLPRIVK